MTETNTDTTETGLPDDAAIEAEVEELTKSEPDKQADKIKSALIAAKRELRDSKRKVKELEPVAEGVTRVQQELENARPLIAALANSPQLRAEALRIAQGKPTSLRTEQPTEDDDPDAAVFADEMGFTLADGTTPDLVKARRLLNVLDKRNGRQTDERIRPLAGTVLGGRAETALREIEGMTDDQGVPLATRESIREVASKLPSHLLANDQVADLVLNSAIGLDRRNKRTPKAPDDYVHLERAGGGRVRQEPVMDDTLKKALERTGISEKQATESIKRLEHVGRRGVELGGR